MTSTATRSVYPAGAEPLSSRFFKGVGTAFVGTVLIAALALLEGFLLMLGLGAAHSVWPVIPAMGFWTTWAILVGLRILLGTFKPAKPKAE